MIPAILGGNRQKNDLISKTDYKMKKFFFISKDNNRVNNNNNNFKIWNRK